MARPRGAAMNTDDTSLEDLGQSDLSRDQSNAGGEAAAIAPLYRRTVCIQDPLSPLIAQQP